MRTAILTLLILVLAPVRVEGEGESKIPYPVGSTLQKYAGLEFQLVIPADFDPKKEYSLMMLLHGNGDSGPNLAPSLRELGPKGFIVAAPSAPPKTWSKPLVNKVREITKHLLDVLPIGKGRLHCCGFSNGGYNLAPLAMDEKLPFVSAVWVASGYSGGKVPKRAKKEMAIMALVGAQDNAVGGARGTVKQLRDKVRWAEVRIEPDLGHKWPRKLMPYYFWWLPVMEGRFVPGDDMSFEWTNTVEEQLKKMAAGKKGGFLYFYSKDDAGKPEAKTLQNEAFFHPYVRFFGEQLVAVKLERSAHEKLFASFKLKKTPAIVTLKKNGDVAKKLSGKISAGKLARALASVARVKSPPKD